MGSLDSGTFFLKVLWHHSWRVSSVSTAALRLFFLTPATIKCIHFPFGDWTTVLQNSEWTGSTKKFLPPCYNLKVLMTTVLWKLKTSRCVCRCVFLALVALDQFPLCLSSPSSCASYAVTLQHFSAQTVHLQSLNVTFQLATAFMTPRHDNNHFYSEASESSTHGPAP